MQRKFTRKPSQVKPFTPIIQFQDYTRSMTPLDRYRKHAMLFDYWNGDLLETLQGTAFNAKRLRHASAESLAELRTLHELLAGDLAPQLAPLVEERAVIDARVQRGGVDPLQAPMLVRQLEAQTRRLHRDFYWRDVEDHLQPMDVEKKMETVP